jgi:hypothetical protein
MNLLRSATIGLDFLYDLREAAPITKGKINCNWGAVLEYSVADTLDSLFLSNTLANTTGLNRLRAVVNAAIKHRSPLLRVQPEHRRTDQ